MHEQTAHVDKTPTKQGPLWENSMEIRRLTVIVFTHNNCSRKASITEQLWGRGKEKRGGDKLPRRQWDAHLSQVLALPRPSLSPAAVSSCVTWMELLQGIQGKIYVNSWNRRWQLSVQKRQRWRGSGLFFQQQDKDPPPPTLRRFFCTPGPQSTRSYWQQSGEVSKQLPVTKEGSQNLKVNNVSHN